MATVTETMQSYCRRTPKGRRFSTIQAATHNALCRSLPHSLEALDLSSASLTPSLASLRLQVLSYLADLEARLSLLDSPISAEWLKSRGELTVEDARTWARDGLELLRVIRTDVSSDLPEFSFDNVPSVEGFLKSHIPDGSSLDGVRSRLPDMPDIRSRLIELEFTDMRSRLDDVRNRLSDIDFHRPLTYIHTLSEHLQSLQAHLSSMEFPHRLSLSSLTQSTKLSELYDKVVSSELISEISADIREGEDRLEKAALEIARAMKQSLNGSRLIQYVDLPEKWRNNPFVKHGYRYVAIYSNNRYICGMILLFELQVYSSAGMAPSHFVSLCTT